MHTHPPAPWARAGNATFHPRLCHKVRRDEPPIVRRAVVAETLERLPKADVEAWTDGSAKEGVADGGAGIAIFAGERQLYTASAPAGKLCSSYRAELIRLCSDSQSAIRRLAAGASRQRGRIEREVWRAITAVTEKHEAHLTVQYVSAHCGVPGNELADELAAAASRDGDQAPCPADLSCAKAALRRAAKKRWLEQAAAAIPQDHQWRRATVQGRPPNHGGAALPRAVQRTLAQLRAGHCPMLG
eukprot:gene16613-4491_t